MLGFMCAAGALNRAQLSRKKIQVTASIYLMHTLQSVRQTSSSNTADIPERLSGGERWQLVQGRRQDCLDWLSSWKLLEFSKVFLLSNYINISPREVNKLKSPVSLNCPPDLGHHSVR